MSAKSIVGRVSFQRHEEVQVCVCERKSNDSRCFGWLPTALQILVLLERGNTEKLYQVLSEYLRIISKQSSMMT